MKKQWFLRRVATNIFVLVVAVGINFLIPRLMPGTAIDLIAGGGKLTAEVRQSIIVRFGLDKAWWEQFILYIGNFFRGDLGYSFNYYPIKVADLIKDALPWTLLVNISALVIQACLGYFLGVTAAWKAGKKTDSVLQTLSLALQSTPLFWLAMVFVYVFAYTSGWFPIAGAFVPGATYANCFGRIADIARHATLPVLTMAIGQFGVFQLILRNTMVSVIKEQYILIAKAKGLSESRVKHAHAARNALLPLITFIGLSLAAAVAGSVFIETVFAYPGIGRMVYTAALNRDYPLLQGCFLIFSILIVFANFVVDIVYMFLDPRIRY